MTFTKLLTVYAAASVIALVGWVLNAAQLYWMAATLFLLPQAGRLFALLEQRGVEVTRVVPPVAHQGEEITVRLQARNLLPLPKLHLTLVDELPRGLTASDLGAVPVHLPPRGVDEAEYSLRVSRRGAHTLPAVSIQSTDPLGLSHRQTRLTLESQILVYPRIVELPAQVLPPEIGGGHSPVDASGRQGEGSSFFGIREYRPGDPLRHVHWRTAARLGRLSVVEWESEDSRDVVLAIETLENSDRDLGPGTTLDLAAGMAASLASALLAGGDSLRLIAPGAAEWKPMPERGMEALPPILEALARMQATSPSPMAAELRQVAPYLSRGTLVFLFAPSPREELSDAVRYLRAANLRPVVYALIDAPSGRATAWDGFLDGLERMQVSVVRLHPDDELVQQLLS